VDTARRCCRHVPGLLRPGSKCHFIPAGRSAGIPLLERPESPLGLRKVSAETQHTKPPKCWEMTALAVPAKTHRIISARSRLASRPRRGLLGRPTASRDNPMGFGRDCERSHFPAFGGFGVLGHDQPGSIGGSIGGAACSCIGRDLGTGQPFILPSTRIVAAIAVQICDCSCKENDTLRKGSFPFGIGVLIVATVVWVSYIAPISLCDRICFRLHFFDQMR
jgi:hypothetical protein